MSWYQPTKHAIFKSAVLFLPGIDKMFLCIALSPVMKSGSCMTVVDDQDSWMALNLLGTFQKPYIHPWKVLLLVWWSAASYSSCLPPKQPDHQCRLLLCRSDKNTWKTLPLAACIGQQTGFYSVALQCVPSCVTKYLDTPQIGVWNSSSFSIFPKPCTMDYHLFHYLNQVLAEKRFSNETDVCHITDDFLAS